MMAYRLTAAAAICILAVILPWWAVAPFAFAYVLFFSRAYELVLLAACVDGFFGSGLTIPMYTIAALALLFIAEWVKPLLSIFNTA